MYYDYFCTPAVLGAGRVWGRRTDLPRGKTREPLTRLHRLGAPAQRTHQIEAATAVPPGGSLHTGFVSNTSVNRAARSAAWPVTWLRHTAYGLEQTPANIAFPGSRLGSRRVTLA